jgi:hypothetical protein
MVHETRTRQDNIRSRPFVTLHVYTSAKEAGADTDQTEIYGESIHYLPFSLISLFHDVF